MFFKSNVKDFPGWIRTQIRIVLPGSGSVTNFFKILDPDPYEMIRIRNTG